MPCRSDYMDPTPTEHAATNKVNKDAKDLADRVTYSSDVLRDWILEGSHAEILSHVNLPYREQLVDLLNRAEKLYYMVPADKGLLAHCKELVDNYYWLEEKAKQDGQTLTFNDTEKVWQQQVTHRKADIARLLVVMAKRQDHAALRRLLDADPTKPLEPQLGFSPDAF